MSIKIPSPLWDSDLANLIIDLEKLRVKNLSTELPLHIFFQLKDIFQMLETLGSARIEGNNTTLSQYVEKVISDQSTDERTKEIQNIEKAIEFIEENIDDYPINRAFLSELHKIVTKSLTPPPKGEGSNYPGELRKYNVKIKNAKHTPPDVSLVYDYFEEFINFINREKKEQYQLLSVAIAHHRFAYIHPYDNANGRVGRLLNYALLIKLGFKVQNGRILNPSSIFYTDRDKYYQMLSNADSLENKDILMWCEYFLKGLKNEIEKIDTLLDISFVKDKILNPAIDYALEREFITSFEERVLKLIIKSDEMTIKSQDLSKIGINQSHKKSRVINRLKDKKMVTAIKDGGRIYTINFINNYLLRGVIFYLEKENFVSDFLEYKIS
jgi:Fic family protein